MVRKACVSLAVVGLLGCANRPLPGDYVGLDTFAIVQKIRCEARDAIKVEIVKNLLNNGASKKSRDLGLAIRDHGHVITLADYKEVDGDQLKFVRKYDDAAIGFSFNFDISETNTADMTLGLQKPFFWGGSAGLGFGSKSSLRRANKRSFIIVDTFSQLVFKLSDKQCAELSGGYRAAYPITGSIGLQEIFQTFYLLNETENLKNKENVPYLEDIVNFQTKITLSANPSLALTHAGLGWQASGATATLSAERLDEHQVTIGVSLPPEKQIVPQAAGKARPARPTAKQRQETAPDLVLRKLESNKAIENFGRETIKSLTNSPLR